MHDISLYLLELLENSVRAQASTVSIGLHVDRASNMLRIIVDDDGRGLTTAPQNAVDPFYTTKTGKKTGLGLSLFKAEAEAAGGSLTLGPSSRLAGTRVEAAMSLDHIDRPPLGDVATSIAVTAATNPDIRFTVTLTGDEFGQALIEGTPAEAVEPLVRCTERLAARSPDYQQPNTKIQASTGPGDAPRNNEHMEVRSMTEEPAKQPGSCACCEEASEEELLGRLDEAIVQYKDKPGALIPILQLAQGVFGYLPEVALKKIAKDLGKPYSEVAGVVTFYSFFSTVPRGRNLIRVCLGTACYVRGGMQVLQALKNELGIDVGGTTEDREFSLEVARCFGACGLAPVITINDKVHHRVKPARIKQVLAEYAPEEALATAGVGTGEGAGSAGERST
jgi:NADH:ubiquinone oxidoreductase subunit E